MVLSFLVQMGAARFDETERKLLRRLFLRRFGLDDLMEQSSRPLKLDMPDYIWELYEKAQEEDQDIVRHHLPSQKSGPDIVFDLGVQHSSLDDEAVDKAMLRVELPRGKVLRGIFTVSMTGSSSVLDSKILPQFFTRNNWIDLDITKAFTANVKRVALTVNFVAASEAEPWTNASDSAALITFIHDKRNPRKRRKRNTKNQKRSSHRKHRKQHVMGSYDGTQCRRTNLYVDFAELNWGDWIIAPAGYDAYQCQGRCSHPMPSHLNTTNHAIIQSLIHSVDPSAVPPPSCVPVETSAISILYRDVNNTVVVKTYAGMKVEACGCH
ncbi:unnamed protein product [Bursaphelenchus okinawaensis]|uniref:TGF-beta family profile domain-containing protein n=1 Tax=Bursaphelenchus okinawaensis TaxID=465554 RepID=A0A811LBV1_9BILA|nr:unnamed protein product [Bursaphelenchus okinawaensis]CAG9120052.1 unnamed protein product [Bursaphelenchus okinawaensis]